MSSDAFGGDSVRARLGVVTNDFPPTVGGIQTYLLSLLGSLDPTEVVVVAPAREGAERCDADFTYEVVRVQATGGVLLPGPANARRITAVMRSRGVEIVGLSSMIPLGPLGRSIARRLNAPLVVWHHGAELAIPARLPVGAHLVRKIGAGVGIHFVVSRWTESIARRVFGPNADIRLMRFGIDSNRFSPPLTPDVDKRAIRRRLGIVAEDADPLVLSVGRLVRRKGNDVLVSAIVLTAARYPDCSLVIVGSGPDRRRLEGLLGEVGAAEKVHFLGEVESENLPDLYRCADVFAAPIRSRFFGLEGEGLGITLVEAAASGLPVVAGRSGGTGEAVADGVGGFIVDGADPYEVAGALGRLAGDRALRLDMGRKGRAFVQAEFSRARMVETYRRAARDLVGTG